jgi:hypothetical protein
MAMKAASCLCVGTLALTMAACGQGSPGDGQTAGYTLVDYVARWDGYAEAFTFRDGSDRVRLVLNANGQGTLQVGDAPLAPAVTDPSLGPPGVWDIEQSYQYAWLNTGFLYPLYEPNVDAKRIRLGADYHDAWRDWCAMQTPVYSQHLGDYSCAPDLTTEDDTSCFYTDAATGALVQIDCLRAAFCEMVSPCTCGTRPTPMVCACTASGCEAPRTTAIGAFFVKIDAALEDDGASLVGTLAIDDVEQRYTIRLTRQ